MSSLTDSNCISKPSVTCENSMSHLGVYVCLTSTKSSIETFTVLQEIEKTDASSGDDVTKCQTTFTKQNKK